MEEASTIAPLRVCRHCDREIRKIRPSGYGLTGWSDRSDGGGIFGSGELCPRRDGGHQPHQPWLCQCAHDPHDHHHLPWPEGHFEGCWRCDCALTYWQAARSATGGPPG